MPKRLVLRKKGRMMTERQWYASPAHFNTEASFGEYKKVYKKKYKK